MAKSLIGRLPSKTRELGPVSAVSYRVASRIANSLRAGHAVRTARELESAAAILFHAPSHQAEVLLELLEKAEILWAGRALIFCDCDDPPAARARFEDMGASTAVARQFGIPGRIAVSGDRLALTAARRVSRALKLKPVDLLPEATGAFDAAVTMSNAAITPLIDSAALLLRSAGIRDTEAARIASALFQQTASDYAHSGKQSWAWYMREPDVRRIETQIAAAGRDPGQVLRRLLVFGIERFGKYPDLGTALRPDAASAE